MNSNIKKAQELDHSEANHSKKDQFSELEKSRMENPPNEREENGSGQEDVDQPLEDSIQSEGIQKD